MRYWAMGLMLAALIGCSGGVPNRNSGRDKPIGEMYPPAEKSTAAK